MKETLSPKERFMRLGETLDRTGLSRSSLYSQVSEGKFPEPVRIGNRSVAWLESAVNAWIQEKINKSQAIGGVK